MSEDGSLVKPKPCSNFSTSYRKKIISRCRPKNTLNIRVLALLKIHIVDILQNSLPETHYFTTSPLVVIMWTSVAASEPIQSSPSVFLDWLRARLKHVAGQCCWPIQTTASAWTQYLFELWSWWVRWRWCTTGFTGSDRVWAGGPLRFVRWVCKIGCTLLTCKQIKIVGWSFSLNYMLCWYKVGNPYSHVCQLRFTAICTSILILIILLEYSYNRLIQ